MWLLSNSTALCCAQVLGGGPPHWDMLGTSSHRHDPTQFLVMSLMYTHRHYTYLHNIVIANYIHRCVTQVNFPPNEFILLATPRQVCRSTALTTMPSHSKFGTQYHIWTHGHPHVHITHCARVLSTPWCHHWTNKVSQTGATTLQGA